MALSSNVWSAQTLGFSLFIILSIHLFDFPNDFESIGIFSARFTRIASNSFIEYQFLFLGLGT